MAGQPASALVSQSGQSSQWASEGGRSPSARRDVSSGMLPQATNPASLSWDEIVEDEIMKSVTNLDDKIMRLVSSSIVEFRLDVCRRLRCIAEHASIGKAEPEVVELGGQPTPSSNFLLSNSFPASIGHNLPSPADQGVEAPGVSSAHGSMASQTTRNSPILSPKRARTASAGEHEAEFFLDSPRAPFQRKLTPDSAEMFDSMAAVTPSPRGNKSPSRRQIQSPDGRSSFVQNWTHQGSRKFENFRRSATSKVVERESHLREMVESKLFRGMCITVIISYAVWLGVVTDYSVRHAKDDDPLAMFIAEVVFVSLFLIELCLKLLAYRMVFFVGDNWAWNWFDLVTVATAFYEAALTIADIHVSTPNVAYLRVLRLLKILRILRVVRIFRFFRELRIMLLSVASSIRSLIWSLVLLILVIYVLAIMFSQAASFYLSQADEESDMSAEMKDILVDFWGTLPKAMITLYQCVSNGLEWKTPVEPFRRESPVYFGLFLLSIAFLTLSMLNILTGIFVENALKASSDDQANVAYDNMVNEQRFVKELQDFIQKMDMDNSGTLSWEEFQSHMEDPYLRYNFERIGLTITDAELFYRLISAHSGQKEVDVESFTAGCLKLKGDAKSLDLQALMYETRVMKKWQQRMWGEVVEIQMALREVLLCRGSATTASDRASLLGKLPGTFNNVPDMTKAPSSDGVSTKADGTSNIEGSCSGTWRGSSWPPSITLVPSYNTLNGSSKEGKDKDSQGGILVTNAVVPTIAQKSKQRGRANSSETSYRRAPSIPQQLICLGTDGKLEL